MTTPLGILGGTFNPIHYGHLRMAEEIGDELKLAEIKVIPAAVPPHRAMPGVTAQHRLEMARLAVAGNARLSVDDRECRRTGPSYTVDTLLELRSELGANRPFLLLLGVDAVLGLTIWSRWQQLFDLTHIVIAHRPGFSLDAPDVPPALVRELETRKASTVSHFGSRSAGMIVFVSITPLDISGTAIRRAIVEGRSPRYLLPDAVLDYIHRHHLYKDLDGV